MRRTSSTEKLAAVAVAVLAVLSPLYIDRRKGPQINDDDDDAVYYSARRHGAIAVWLPVTLIALVVIINLTRLMDRRYMRFDPYWIHRVGGSSGGIITLLFLLAFVLKFKSSLSKSYLNG